MPATEHEADAHRFRPEFRIESLVLLPLLVQGPLPHLMLSTLPTHPSCSAIFAQNTNEALNLLVFDNLSQMASIELPNQNNTDFESHYNVGDRLGSYVFAYSRPTDRVEARNWLSRPPRFFRLRLVCPN